MANVTLRERLAKLGERARFWAAYWKFKALKVVFLRLIRFVLGRKQEDDDYLHEGQVVEYDRIPVRSTKADGKRAALKYARERTKNPNLTWKSARKLLNAWEREERMRQTFIDGQKHLDAMYRDLETADA